MEYFHLSDIDWKEIVPGFKGRFIHSENMTFVYWDIEADASLPEHSHPHEQVISVIEGELDLTVDNKIKKIGPGSVIIVPPNAGVGSALGFFTAPRAFDLVRSHKSALLETDLNFIACDGDQGGSVDEVSEDTT